MVPGAFATPVAVVFVIGGLITCFAGYRLFRFVLALYGFFAGAMFGSSVPDPSSTFAIIVGFVAGGVVGAIIMVLAYFLAVGLIGAGLAALVLHAGWRIVGGDPPALVVVLVCVLGALIAIRVQRLVMILGSAVAGSWTAITGAVALMGDPKALLAASAPGVSVIYPADLMPPNTHMMLAWIALAVIGMTVQLKTTSTMGKRKTRK